MRFLPSAWLVAALGCVFVTSRSTAEEQQETKLLESAFVVMFEKEQVSKVYRLGDESQLAALEAIFPDYRNRPKGRRANAWVPRGEVYFNFANGETVRLEIGYINRPIWRVSGRGDNEMNGDLDNFVAALKPGGAWTGPRR